MVKKQRPKAGDVVEVQIDESFHTYARVLNFSDLAFYDAISNQSVDDIDDIVSSPILFKAIVNTRGVQGGLWPIVGNVPLEKELQHSIYYLIDVTDPNHFRISENGAIRSASKEECIGLEVHAIWDPIHIQ